MNQWPSVKAEPEQVAAPLPGGTLSADTVSTTSLVSSVGTRGVNAGVTWMFDSCSDKLPAPTGELNPNLSVLLLQELLDAPRAPKRSEGAGEDGTELGRSGLNPPFSQSPIDIRN